MPDTNDFKHTLIWSYHWVIESDIPQFQKFAISGLISRQNLVCQDSI